MNLLKPPTAGPVLRRGDGLYYNRFRYYDRSMGRYASADPIWQAGGANLFAYATNNPVAAIDPLGLDASLYRKDPRTADPTDYTGSQGTDDECCWTIVNTYGPLTRDEANEWNRTGTAIGVFESAAVGIGVSMTLGPAGFGAMSAGGAGSAGSAMGMVHGVVGALTSSYLERGDTVVVTTVVCKDDSDSGYSTSTTVEVIPGG